MGGENDIDESMDIEILPSTSGYNVKNNKQKDGKLDHLPWYVFHNIRGIFVFSPLNRIFSFLGYIRSLI